MFQQGLSAIVEENCLGVFVMTGSGEITTEEHLQQLERKNEQLKLALALKDDGWFVYILLCHDNSLYTGITKDLQRRLQEHNDGVGAKYTRGRRPVSLFYWERQPNRASATSRENAIKSLPRPEKLLLHRNTGGAL